MTVTVYKTEVQTFDPSTGIVSDASGKERDLVTLQEAGVVLLEGQRRGYYKPDRAFRLPL